MSTFTLNQAILTALQRNPALLNAEQEIKRTRGVIIQVRAQAAATGQCESEFSMDRPEPAGLANIRNDQRDNYGIRVREAPPLFLNRPRRRSEKSGYLWPLRSADTIYQQRGNERYLVCDQCSRDAADF